MGNFTFKKVIHEGRYKSFETPRTTIKISKKEVGYLIRHFEPEGEYWRIHFAIKHPEAKAGFKWISLKHKEPTEETTRAWLKKHQAKIQEVYDLFQFED